MEEFRVFTTYLSSISPSIKFTVQHNCHQLELLDVLVKKENGLLETTVCSKKADGHMYLLPSSCHFHTVSKNMPYDVALWLKRICSTETEFNMKSDKYQIHLIARGHSKKSVRKQFHKASLISREAALTKTPKNHSNNKIVFNLDCHLAFKNVGAIIHKHLPILNKSARMKVIFDPSNTRILTGFRRHKNLKELLSPASFPNTHRKQQPPPNAGCQKCKKKCSVCQNFLLESPSMTSVGTGASFKIKEAVSCKDSWVIYGAIRTKCNLQDVGSTKTPFYARWSSHKSHINCKRKTRTLTKHFIEKSVALKTLK